MRRADLVECEWWCETEKRVGVFRERACRWRQRCSFAPNGDFGISRFKGNHILRDLMRLRNRWRFTPANGYSKSA